MIALHWYFWVVAALTLNSACHDVANVWDTIANKTDKSIWFMPTIIGVLWCVYHVLWAVCP